jgi:hypothetical protein
MDRRREEAREGQRMTEEHEVPAYFAAFIAAYFGERGAAWLAELPDPLARYAPLACPISCRFALLLQ